MFPLSKVLKRTKSLRLFLDLAEIDLTTLLKLTQVGGANKYCRKSCEYHWRINHSWWRGRKSSSKMVISNLLQTLWWPDQVDQHWLKNWLHPSTWADGYACIARIDGGGILMAKRFDLITPTHRMSVKNDFQHRRNEDLTKSLVS